MIGTGVKSKTARRRHVTVPASADCDIIQTRHSSMYTAHCSADCTRLGCAHRSKIPVHTSTRRIVACPPLSPPANPNRPSHKRSTDGDACSHTRPLMDWRKTVKDVQIHWRRHAKIFGWTKSAAHIATFKLKIVGRRSPFSFPRSPSPQFPLSLSLPLPFPSPPFPYK